MTRSSRLFVAGTFALCFRNSFAQNSTSSDCYSYEEFGPDGSVYNASGSYQVLGFQEPRNRTTPSNWTYNYAIRADKDGDSWSGVSIETSDGRDIGSPDRPYVGCISIILGLPQSTNKRGQDDNGDCKETFDESCVSAFLSMVNTAAGERSRNGDDAQRICSSLASTTIPEECTKFDDNDRWGGISYPAIGNDTSSNGTHSDECRKSAQGANKGSFGWGTRGSGNNDTGYDEAITRVIPILTAVWLKEGEYENGSTPWADSRLTCMTGRDIKAGSKEPKGVPSLGVKAVTGGFIKGTILMAVIAIGGMIL